MCVSQIHSKFKVIKFAPKTIFFRIVLRMSDVTLALMLLLMENKHPVSKTGHTLTPVSASTSKQDADSLSQKNMQEI